MADVIHRTDRKNYKLLRLRSVHTPDYPSGTWIVNPDLSALDGVDEIYWKVSGDTVVEMTTGEKAAVDASILSARNSQIHLNVRDRLGISSPLEGLSIDVSVTGLTVTSTIDTVVIDDVTNVTADSTDTKFVKLCYLYSSSSDTFYVAAFERTTGVYAELASDETEVAQLGEWSVTANGASLNEV